MNNLKWKDINGRWGLVDSKTDLRRAAQMALDILLDLPLAVRTRPQTEAIQALRQALSEPRWSDLTEDEAYACRGIDFFDTYKNINDKLKEKNA